MIGKMSLQKAKKLMKTRQKKDIERIRKAQRDVETIPDLLVNVGTNDHPQIMTRQELEDALNEKGIGE